MSPAIFVAHCYSAIFVAHCYSAIVVAQCSPGGAPLPPPVVLWLCQYTTDTTDTAPTKGWQQGQRRRIKGTVTQNIFSLKSGPKSCKDLGNDNDLQK